MIFGLRLGSSAASSATGIAHQLVDRHLLVGDAVDEARIGAVLEQAADEIGEQLLVAADRRVDPHRRARVADRGFEPGELLVQLLAHAVEALELELAALRQRFDLADGVGVVGREGGVDDVARRKQHSAQAR